MAQKALLLDVMLSDGTFFCQIRYTGTPFPMIIEGKMVPTYDYRDLRKFALEKRPSLANKKFDVIPTNQRVY